MAKRTRGSGSVYLTPGSDTWQAQWYVNGQRFQESTHTENKRLAEAYLRDRIADSVVNGRPTSSAVTVGDLVKAKLTADRNNGLKDVKSNDGRWERNLSPFFGRVKARDLQTAMLDRYVEKRRLELLGKYERQAQSSEAKAIKAEKKGKPEGARALRERATEAAKKIPNSSEQARD